MNFLQTDERRWLVDLLFRSLFNFNKLVQITMVKDDEYYIVCNSHVVRIWPSKMIFVQKTDHPIIAVDFSIIGFDLVTY